MDIKNTYTVTSTGQFIEQVRHIRDTWAFEDKEFFNPWFRGQRDASWGLTPSLYRYPDLNNKEARIRANFKRQGSLLVMERVPSSDWEWYFLMQHYGAPTRLLDWSDGALLALFFALSPSSAGSPDIHAGATVWVLDPKWLNKQVIGKHEVLSVDSKKEVAGYLPDVYGEALQETSPVALSPVNIARRLGVQRSRFTIHGTDKEGLQKHWRRRRSRLVKIIIKESAIHKMRMDLGTCGIWDTTIFPDLEGLGREILRDWTDYWV
jgi:hypothetical protein